MIIVRSTSVKNSCDFMESCVSRLSELLSTVGKYYYVFIYQNTKSFLITQTKLCLRQFMRLSQRRRIWDMINLNNEWIWETCVLFFFVTKSITTRQHLLRRTYRNDHFNKFDKISIWITMVRIQILNVKIIIAPVRFKDIKCKYHNEIVPSSNNFFFRRASSLNLKYFFIAKILVFKALYSFIFGLTCVFSPLF